MTEQKPYLFPETLRLKERLDAAVIIPGTAERLLALKTLRDDTSEIFKAFDDRTEKAGGWQAKARAAGTGVLVTAVTIFPLAVALWHIGIVASVFAGLFSFEGMRNGQRKKFADAYGDMKAAGEVWERTGAYLDRSISSGLILDEIRDSPRKSELLEKLPRLAAKFEKFSSPRSAANVSTAAAESTPLPKPALPDKTGYCPLVP